MIIQIIKENNKQNETKIREIPVMNSHSEPDTFFSL